MTSCGGIRRGHDLLAHLLLFVSMVMLAFVAASPADAQQGYPQSTPAGLQLIPNSQFAVAYVRPGVDFSNYTKVMILDPEIAFKRTWRSQHRDVGSNDMSRIRRELAALLSEVFSNELQNNGGFEVVSDAGEDVLIIRPGIVDLDVEAPFTGQGYSFTTSAGAATLTLDIFDSVSGEVLAQAADRQVARHAMGAGSGPNNFQRATRVSNRLDAERVLTYWAQNLREALEEIRR
jgi:hypothetical protein